MGVPRRQTLSACDDRCCCVTWSCARLLERNGAGPIRICRRCCRWIGFRGVCAVRPYGCVRCAVANALGTNRRTGRRQLDRGQRSSAARAVIARKVTAQGSKANYLWERSRAMILIKRNELIILLIGLLLLAFSVPIKAQVPNEGIANMIIQARQKNAAQLKQYTWTCRIELTQNG